MAHTHEGDQNYFVDQLFTIFLCGGLSACAIVLANIPDGLFFLHSRFRPFVLWGGIALGVMVLIRATALWILAGNKEPDCCDHDHDHDHAHHDHHHHDHHHHDHDHDHEHGWAPWRYVILLLPVLMFFLKLPYGAPVKAGQAVDASSLKLSKSTGKVEVPNLKFQQLEWMRKRPDAQAYFSGKIATIKGQFVSTPDPTQFNLVRYKMQCCAADAVPLRAVLMVDPDWRGEQLKAGKLHGKWVEVEGQIHFFPGGSPGEMIPALILRPTETRSPNKLVKVIKPETKLLE